MQVHADMYAVCAAFYVLKPRLQVQASRINSTLTARGALVRVMEYHNHFDNKIVSRLWNDVQNAFLTLAALPLTETSFR